MHRRWEGSAPSNIALVKYMGKESGGVNLATNPSLSMTLANFRTNIELVLRDDFTEDRWEPLPDCAPIRAESTVRFLDFFRKLKQKENIKANFLVRSGNNFPSDAGLASSASSFAALTKISYAAFSELQEMSMPTPESLARISREGSGSSCRSFFSPWCAWEGEKIYAPKSKLPELVDLVVILDSSFKKVSSSEAHKRVRSSPLFENRPERARERMQKSLTALETGDFHSLAEIAYADLWDMHSLFHTSAPPFFYFAPETIAVLRFVEDMWERFGSGPLATIDAGPNVHLLVPVAEKDKTIAELQSFLGTTPKILESLA